MVLNKIDEVLNKITFLEEEIVIKSEDIDQRQKKADNIEEQIEINTKALSMLMLLYEKLNERGLKVLDKIMEGALVRVFSDREYSVFHQITMERGANQLRFYLKELKEGREIVSDMRVAVGGGVRSIAGLICICFYLMRSKACRLIVLDENLSQVDDTCIEALFELLRSFAQAGFVFILITHDVRFKPYLDKEYIMGVDGFLRLKTRKEE